MKTQISTILAEGNALQKNSPTESLTHIWRVLSSSGIKKNIKSKEFLFLAGNPVKNIYIVTSGYLLLIKNDTILDIIEPGQSVGAALISANRSNQVYPISAQALGSCQLLQLSTNKVNELIQTENTINEYFMNEFRERMNHLQFCRTIEGKTAALRIAHFLILKKNILSQGLVTRKIIARAVNTTTETVIRTLAEFQKNNIVSCRGRQITLLDLSYLERLCA